MEDSVSRTSGQPQWRDRAQLLASVREGALAAVASQTMVWVEAAAGAYEEKVRNRGARR